MDSYDEEQLRLLGEQCILVDTNDHPLGPISKEKSHKSKNIRDGMLHRAFSVFLFNTKGELLLQQRAKSKITFPAYWTNTCCSHPLYVKEELEEKENLGVKLAAIRKLEHELGISKGTIQVKEFIFLTKLHYQAIQDEEWGEHEIDHILVVQKDVKVDPNKNEVMATRYVTPSQLKELFAQRNVQLKQKDSKEEKLFITPWFEIICNEFLFKWWDDLSTLIHNGGLKEKSEVHIHRISLPPSFCDEPTSSSSTLTLTKSNSSTLETLNGHPDTLETNGRPVENSADPTPPSSKRKRKLDKE